MTKKYTLIYADPPWVYRDKAADGNRGAGFKYPVMSVLDICRLPVWDLTAENCLLAMWWVPTQPLEALKVVEAWVAHSGIRFVPIPAVTDAEFATLSAIFADKIESLAAEAEMEENQQNN